MGVQETWRLQDWESVCRRAGGRRRYNATRQVRARVRRESVARLWLAGKGRRGWQARAARQLGVSPATISRDFDAMLAWLCQVERPPRCPLRGASTTGELVLTPRALKAALS